MRVRKSTDDVQRPSATLPTSSTRHAPTDDAHRTSPTPLHQTQPLLQTHTRHRLDIDLIRARVYVLPSSSSSLTRSRLGPQRRSRVTAACLHRVAMAALLLSRRSWSVCLVRSRSGGRFHVGSGGRPTDSSTWRSMAWCAGVLSGNLATMSEYGIATSANPVRHRCETSA